MTNVKEEARKRAVELADELQIAYEHQFKPLAPFIVSNSIINDYRVELTLSFCSFAIVFQFVQTPLDGDTSWLVIGPYTKVDSRSLHGIYAEINRQVMIRALETLNKIAEGEE